MSKLSESAITEAIRELQRIAGIPITGTMDENTKFVFTRKRCGLKDTEILSKNKLRSIFKS